MRGEPSDVDGECNAHLYIGDNYGDNHATMRCGLLEGHDGVHREVFSRTTTEGPPSECVMTWEQDERCRHDWIALDTEEGKELYLRDLYEEDGSLDPQWTVNYEEGLKYGSRYFCQKCLAMVKEKTTRALP
jgi:hypothetical protein